MSRQGSRWCSASHIRAIAYHGHAVPVKLVRTHITTPATTPTTTPATIPRPTPATTPNATPNTTPATPPQTVPVVRSCTSAAGVVVRVVAGSWMWVLTSFTGTAWPWYAIARIWLALHHRLALRLLASSPMPTGEAFSGRQALSTSSGTSNYSTGSPPGPSPRPSDCLSASYSPLPQQPFFRPLSGPRHFAFSNCSMGPAC